MDVNINYDFADFLGGGPKTYSDACIVSSEGHLIPIHMFVFRMRNETTGLYELLTKQKEAEGDNPRPRLYVQVELQILWRVLTYVYLNSYVDDDQPLTFEMVKPPQYSPSRLICSKGFDEVEDLAVGFERVQVTSKKWTAAVFAKAWASLKVHNAASLWTMERLLTESSQRFGAFVAGSYNEDEFPEFLDAIFKHVSDPSQTLYASVVQECVSNFQALSTNERILVLIQKHGLLGRLLIERLAALSGFSHMASTTGSPNTTTTTDFTNTTSASNVQAVVPFVALPFSESSINSTVIEDLKSQLNEAHNDFAVKSEMVIGQEKEITRLKEKTFNQEKEIDTQKSDINSLKTLNKNIADQLVHKTKVLSKIQDEFDIQEQKMMELEAGFGGAAKTEDVTRLEAEVKRLNHLNTALTQQVNEKRLGQPHNTDHMVESDEARAKTDALIAQVKNLRAQLDAKDDEFVHVDPVSSAQNGEPKRAVQEFGALTSAMNLITIGTGVSTAPAAAASHVGAPIASPTPRQEQTQSHYSQPANMEKKFAAINIMKHVGSTPTFIQKVMEAQRIAAAGLKGGEVENVSPHKPSSSISHAAFDTPPKPAGPHSKPGDLFSKSVGPHSLRPQAHSFQGAPVTNGVAHPSSTAAAGSEEIENKDRRIRELEDQIKQLNAKVIAAGNDAQRLHELEEIIKQLMVRVKAAGLADEKKVQQIRELEKQIKLLVARINACRCGGGGTSADEKKQLVEQQKQIKVLNVKAEFLQSQLNDARNGPVNRVQPGPVGPPGGDRRLRNVLKALEEQANDHKACNECLLDFNCEYRGIVDKHTEPELILICSKCGSEKCRWRV